MKKIVVTIKYIIAFAAIVYTGMILSVLPVVFDAHSVIMNTYEGDSYALSKHYNTSKYGNDANRESLIFPFFAFHNGHHGYLYVYHRYRVWSEEDTLTYSGWSYARWEIEKIDGSWHVISIYESP